MRKIVFGTFLFYILIQLALSLMTEELIPVMPWVKCFSFTDGKLHSHRFSLMDGKWNFHRRVLERLKIFAKNRMRKWLAEVWLKSELFSEFLVDCWPQVCGVNSEQSLFEFNQSKNSHGGHSTLKYRCVNRKLI